MQEVTTGARLQTISLDIFCNFLWLYKYFKTTRFFKITLEFDKLSSSNPSSRQIWWNGRWGRGDLGIYIWTSSWVSRQEDYTHTLKNTCWLVVSPFSGWWKPAVQCSENTKAWPRPDLPHQSLWGGTSYLSHFNKLPGGPSVIDSGQTGHPESIS